VTAMPHLAQSSVLQYPVLVAGGAAVQPSPGAAAVDRQRSSLFTQIDKDNDGVITRAEWNQAQEAGLVRDLRDVREVAEQRFASKLQETEQFMQGLNRSIERQSVGVMMETQATAQRYAAEHAQQVERMRQVAARQAAEQEAIRQAAARQAAAEQAIAQAAAARQAAEQEAVLQASARQEAMEQAVAQAALAQQAARQAAEQEAVLQASARQGAMEQAVAQAALAQAAHTPSRMASLNSPLPIARTRTNSPVTVRSSPGSFSIPTMVSLMPAIGDNTPRSGMSLRDNLSCRGSQVSQVYEQASISNTFSQYSQPFGQQPLVSADASVLSGQPFWQPSTGYAGQQGNMLPRQQVGQLVEPLPTIYTEPLPTIYTDASGQVTAPYQPMQVGQVQVMEPGLGMGVGGLAEVCAALAEERRQRQQLQAQMQGVLAELADCKARLDKLDPGGAAVSSGYGSYVRAASPVRRESVQVVRRQSGLLDELPSEPTSIDRPLGQRVAPRTPRDPLRAAARIVEERGNVQVNRKSGQIKLIRDLRFMPRSTKDEPTAVFREPDVAEAICKDLAEISNIFQSLTIVEGHTKGGESRFWQTLAEGRATMVAERMIAYGANASLLETCGKPGKKGKNEVRMEVYILDINKGNIQD